jgi:hypothetical protein
MLEREDKRATKLAMAEQLRKLEAAMYSQAHPSQRKVPMLPEQREGYDPVTRMQRVPKPLEILQAIRIVEDIIGEVPGAYDAALDWVERMKKGDMVPESELVQKPRTRPGY